MQTIMMISTVVIAFATVIYATLTYFLLREQRREKEKPRIQEVGEVVIYPLIGKLEGQKYYLKEGNFGWTEHYLKHVDRLTVFLDMEKLIYDDFKKAFPKTAAKIKEYDKKVEKLKEGMDKFADKIKSLPDFENAVLRKFEEYKSGANLSNASFFEPTTKNLGYILENIINNRQKLGTSDAYNDFWNQYGEQLLKFREGVKVKNYNAEVEEKRKILLELSDSILGDLRAILNGYRKKYGITYKEVQAGKDEIKFL